METQTWNKASEILAEVLQIPDVRERNAFISRRCADEPDVWKMVESLLEQLDSSITLEQPALASGSTCSVVGERMGAYRVLAEIGRGGMGEVYRAERADGQFERTVAIKVISGGFGSADSERRFRAERMILAGLKHPHIAELLDAGITDQGRPYIVLEYVDGESITKYCRSHNTSLRDKIRLFQKISSAVHYAHQRLVIHRDLKPANILVTADGVPKLLDFGIAKLLEAPHEEETAAWLRCFTANFASPEQLRGERLSIASDIYSLGVVLYGLLTDAKPYDLTKMSTAEAIRTVTEAGVPLPSARAGVDARVALRNDLDAIVMKAMAKSHADRYQSAQELAQDLENYLTGKPVTAAHWSGLYVARKFVARHARAVAAAAVLALVAAGGVVSIVWEGRVAARERQRAERRYREVRELANSVLLDFQRDLAQIPGTLAVRKKVIAKAVQHLDGLRQEAREPEFQLELAAGYQELADVQGGSNWGLGDVKGAYASYLQAKSLIEAAIAANPSAKEAQIRLGKILTEMCYFVGRNDKEKLNATERTMSVHWEQLSKLYPQDNWILLGLADGLGCSAGKADPPERLRMNRKALAIYEQLLRKWPDDQKLKYDTALKNKYVAANLASNSSNVEDRKEALRYAERAVILDRERMSQSPADPRIRLDYTFSLSTLASTWSLLGDVRKAADTFQELVDVRRGLWEQEPKNDRLLGSYFSGLYYFGERQALAGDRAGARRTYELALSLPVRAAPTEIDRQMRSTLQQEIQKLRQPK